MDKLKMARKMMTKEEKKRGKRGLRTLVPAFLSEAWTKRKQAIADRVKRQQTAAHERALARKEAKKLEQVKTK